MSKNPFKDSTKKTGRAVANSFLDLGVVKQADDNAQHTVLVEILSTDQRQGPVVASVMAAKHGDISVPEPGTLVVLGRVKGRRPIVLGTLYSTDDSVPSYSPRDRRVAHDSTQAQFKIDEDGTVRIDSETGQPVLINGSEPQTGVNRVDVSDNGALVVEDVADINFSTLLSVVDDGDGTVTINVDEGSISHDAIDQTTVSASDHHAKYTDAEAVAAVEAENPLNIAGVLQLALGGEIRLPTTNLGDWSIDEAITDAVTIRLSGTGGSEFTLTADGVDYTTATLSVGGEQVVTKRTGDEIFLAEDSTTNINSSSWTDVAWSGTTISDGPYSTDGTTVTISDAGTYEIVAECDFTSDGAVTRASPNMRILHNGAQTGVMGRSGYMRDAEGHNAASVHARAIVTVAANDTVHVEAIGEGDTGISISPDNAQLYIKRLLR